MRRFEAVLKGMLPSVDIPLAPPAPPASVLDLLLGCDHLMEIVLSFLGPLGTASNSEKRMLGHVIQGARVVPGLCCNSRIKVGPFGATLLAGDKALGGLSLERSSAWEHVFYAIQVNLGLRKLCLAACGLGTVEYGMMVRALADNGSLEVLDIRGNNFNHVDMQMLAAVLSTNSTLRTLDLRDNNLEAFAVIAIAGALATNVGLRNLRLRNNNMRDIGARAMVVALASNSTLLSLGVGNNSIGEASSAELARVMLSNDRCESIEFTGNRIGAATIRAITTAVSGHDSLRVLLLSQNPGVEWVPLLLALKHNSVLRVLALRSCGLGKKDGFALAAALQGRLVSLRVLVLSDNRRLNDDACGAIVKAGLHSRSHLQILKLAATGMGQNAIDILAASLCESKRLLTLDISRNLPHDRATNRAGLLRQIVRHETLREVDLSYCGIKAFELQALTAYVTDEGNRSLQVLKLGSNDLLDDVSKGSYTLASLLTQFHALRYLDLHNNNLGDLAANVLVSALPFAPMLRGLVLDGNNLNYVAMRRLHSASVKAGCRISSLSLR